MPGEGFPGFCKDCKMGPFEPMLPFCHVIVGE